MRKPVRTFSYTAVLADTDFRSSDILVLASSDADEKDEPLAGHAPTLRFLKDRMILIAAPGSSSHLKWCSFQVGDTVRRAARAGDRLLVSRHALDGIVLSIFRDERLLVAAGALVNAPLGPDVRVMSTGPRYPDLRVEIDVRGHQRMLCDRESATIEGYEIYVERTSVRSRYGGASESVSIAAVDDSVVMNAARRSAVLMAEQYEDPLCGERVDGTMIKSRYWID